jgi:uncharacterized membrane protein
MRNFLLFLHIAAGGTWLGANFAQGVISPRLLRADHATAASWARTTIRMGNVLYPPAGAIVLITGVLLVLNTTYEFSNAFVVIGMAVVIIGILTGILVFAPQGRRSAEMHEAGGSPELPRVNARILQFAVLDTLLVLFAIFAMVYKLGA